jgi:3-mercaptopyruvate sulfurtransferase SseA
MRRYLAKEKFCFAGGLQEWEQAGYPLEGEWVKKQEA